MKRQAQLDVELKAADADVATYRQKVDLLGGLRREHAADEAEQPWAGFRRQEHEARGKLESIERVQTALAADRQRAEQLDAQVTLLRGRLEAFAEQEAAAKTRSAAVEAAQQAVTAAAHLWLSGSPRPARRKPPTKPHRSLLRRVRQATPARAWPASLTN